MAAKERKDRKTGFCGLCVLCGQIPSAALCPAMRYVYRSFLAFVITPWVPVILALISNGENPVLTLFYSYFFTFVIGLPLYQFLKAWHWDRLRGFIIGGMSLAMSVMFALAMMALGGVPTSDTAIATGVAGLYGATMGLVFGLIRGKRREAP